MRLHEMPIIGNAQVISYTYAVPLGNSKAFVLVRRICNLRAWHYIRFRGWRPWKEGATP